MNEQKAPTGIEWVRLPKADGSFTRGFTWNVVQGCKHDCHWTMPDGAVAECYAKTVAERFRSDKFMPDGFEAHYFHPDRLKEPLRMKEPAGIFLDSFSDLMGHWVQPHEIDAVLDVCREAHWHTFFLLTKNAPRLQQFTFPPNVWVGASSPPDWMFGKALTRPQQAAMLRKTLQVLGAVDAPVKWLSAEPLSWDITPIIQEHRGALRWMVIGAASNGKREYPPEQGHVQALIEELDAQGVPVFFKGNLRSLAWARANWRADFPSPFGVTVKQEVVRQLVLL